MKTLGLIIGCVLLLSGSLAGADQTDPALPDLFSKLRSAETRQDAIRVERRIWTIWKQHDDPRVEARMRAGIRYMGTSFLEKARDTFSDIIEIAPDYAEGWNKRATVYYLMGHYEASVTDIARTLQLEPRHFGALSGLGQIYRQLDDPGQALEIFETVLEIHPHAASTAQAIEELRAELRRRQI